MNKIKKLVIFLAFGLPIVLGLAIIIVATIQIQQFVRDYEFKFQNVFLIEPRNKPVTLIHEAQAKEVDPADMTTEEYICYKFGKDCKMALAVSQAENGTRQCDRFGVNTNRTIDIGVFQINSVHMKKGYTLKDLSDCHKNTDVAYEIFQAQGFTPWVVFQTGAYKRFLTK